MTRLKLVSALAVIAVLGSALVASSQDATPPAPMAGPGPGGAPMAAKFWTEADTNGDGIVTAEELAAAAAARFAAADTDGDGFLSAAEMAAAAEARDADRRAAMRERMAARMLDRRDDNGDGKLSPDEMRLARAGEGFLKRFDTDGDGSVSKAEYDAVAAKMQDRRGKWMSRMGDRSHGDHDDCRMDRDGKHHGDRKRWGPRRG